MDFEFLIVAFIKSLCNTLWLDTFDLSFLKPQVTTDIMGELSEHFIKGVCNCRVIHNIRLYDLLSNHTCGWPVLVPVVLFVNLCDHG